MGNVTILPTVTSAGVTRAFEGAMLPPGSIVVKKGTEKVGRRFLAYVDFEDPRRPGEITRLYLEP